MAAPSQTPQDAEQAQKWLLDPAIVFLNHGSFGACPRAVLQTQQRLRERLEQEPVRFFLREYDALLEAARATLARFVGAQSDDLVMVQNATTAVNTVLASLALAPGDELLTTDHDYNACHNALVETARKAGARVVVAQVPFPVASAEEIVAAVLERVTDRTRLALLDHITSPTALVWPLKALVAALAERGVDTLVDGAHGVGMVPLELDRLGAAYYTSNCHKWLCAPKGAAFLYVRRDRQAGVRPLVISHGANTPQSGRSQFQNEFAWTGTTDATAFLCVPAAIDFGGSLLAGGWPALMAHNHAKALAARRILCDALGIAPPCPDDMLGAMAALPLPEALRRSSSRASGSSGTIEPLQDRLFQEHGIEVPVFSWPRGSTGRLLRISAQRYNTAEQYRRLADALVAIRGAE